MNTIKIITKAVADELDIDPIEVTAEADLREDLNIDSLVLLELLLGVEDELGVRFSKNDFKNVNTINDIAELVEKRKDQSLAPEEY